MARIGEGSELKTILVTYDKMESKLDELIESAESSRQKKKYDDAIRRELKVGCENVISNLVAMLNVRITSFAKTAGDEEFLSIIRRKQRELPVVEEVNAADIGRSAGYGRGR